MIRFDLSGVSAAQAELANDQKNMKFAMALAINRTLKARQKVMRAHTKTALTVRQGAARKLMRDAIQIGDADWADEKVDRFVGRIRIIGGDTAANTDVMKRIGAILLRQDQGGEQTSSRLYRSQRNAFVVGGFPIPAPGLRTASRGVPRSLYPDAIGLGTRSTRYEDSDDAARQYKGGKKKRGGFKKRTRYYFVKEGVGIFVRQQVGKDSEYDAVWFFKTRIHLPKRLNFERQFMDGLDTEFQARLAAAVTFALRTAK